MQLSVFVYAYKSLVQIKDTLTDLVVNIHYSIIMYVFSYVCCSCVHVLVVIVAASVLPYSGIRCEFTFKYNSNLNPIRDSFRVRVCLDTRSARLQDEEWEGRENLREEDRKSGSERAEGRFNLNYTSFIVSLQ